MKMKIGDITALLAVILEIVREIPQLFKNKKRERHGREKTTEGAA